MLRKYLKRLDIALLDGSPKIRHPPISTSNQSRWKFGFCSSKPVMPSSRVAWNASTAHPLHGECTCLQLVLGPPASVTAFRIPPAAAVLALLRGRLFGCWLTFIIWRLCSNSRYVHARRVVARPPRRFMSSEGSKGVLALSLSLSVSLSLSFSLSLSLSLWDYKKVLSTLA